MDNVQMSGKTADRKRIWVIRLLTGNPLDKMERPGRSVVIAKYLADRGHKVTYFGTAYQHVAKKWLYDKTVRQQLSENEYVVMLRGRTAYKKNISLRRLIYGYQIADALKKEIADLKKYPKPDLIFISYPTAEGCVVAEEYGKKYGVPVVIDARDQWPDIFENAIPKPMRMFSPLILKPLKNIAANVFKNADAICSPIPMLLKWGLQYADREKRKLDIYAYTTTGKCQLSELDMKSELTNWKEIGIEKNHWIICSFTSLSKALQDFDTVIDAVENVHEKYEQVRLVIAGKGDDEDRLREKVKNKTFIKMVGWINEAQMTSLMSIGKVGLMPTNLSGKENFGNRVGQFFSAGLPILNSAQGYAKRYLEKYQAGVTYYPGDTAGLEEILIELIGNPHIMKEMSINASKRYDSDFEIEAVMDKIEKMMMDLIKK